MVPYPHGRNGLHAPRPAVLMQYACVCVFAPSLPQLTEGRIAPLGDSRLNIVIRRTALSNLVNTFVRNSLQIDSIFSWPTLFWTIKMFKTQVEQRATGVVVSLPSFEHFMTPFLWQIRWIEHGFTNAFKLRTVNFVFNENKLQKQICIKLVFIPFKEVLKCTELLLWVRENSNFHSFVEKVDQQLILAIFAVRLSQIVCYFCLVMDFWEVQSIKSLPIVSSLNISKIAVVLSLKF